MNHPSWEALGSKQQRFVEEFLVDCNGTKAAIRAGYSRKTARQMAAHNLTKPAICSAIKFRRDQLTANCDVTAERTLYHLACICFADIRKLFDSRGRPKRPHELDLQTAAAIASIERTGKTIKYRFWSKTEALNLAGRYLKLFKEDAPTQPQAGMYVLLAPAMATPDEWDKIVKTHMQYQERSEAKTCSASLTTGRSNADL